MPLQPVLLHSESHKVNVRDAFMLCPFCAPCVLVRQRLGFF